MIERRFVQCDVFSSVPLMGNGLAVVVDGNGLSDLEMQAFAAWTNLSETTYLLSPTHPEADYKLRIFTPTKELAFAGHPTLGSCAAWLHAGGTPRCDKIVIQECNIGNVEIDLSGELAGFVAPDTTATPMPKSTALRIAKALEIAPEAVKSAHIFDNGSVWHLLELASATALMGVCATKVIALPDFGVGLMALSRPDAASDFDIRMLSARTPRYEDPITGSLNAAVGMWLLQQGRLTKPTTMAQGAKVGRDGEVLLLPRKDGKILVAGRTTIVITGKVML
jgi:PhzF family phenazine biosynthesis protein